MFFNKIPFSNQFFFLSFNYDTNTTSRSRNQPNFIKNGLCPWHFHNPNFLKFVVNISFLVFWGGGTHSSSTSIVTVSSMAFGSTINISSEKIAI